MEVNAAKMKYEIRRRRSRDIQQFKKHEDLNSKTSLTFTIGKIS